MWWVIGIVLWIAGALIFAHVWMRRMEMVQFDSGPKFTGWNDHYFYDSYYSLTEIGGYSLFVWIPLTLIISGREFGKMVGRGCANTFRGMATVVAPRHVKQQITQPIFNPLPKLSEDRYALMAAQEVEEIAPE
jgi:hypothetical protein